MSEAIYRILAVNTGSSSLKARLYELGPTETLVLAAAAERIGTAEARLRISDPRSATPLDHPAGFTDHAGALRAIADVLRERDLISALDAIGHRVVHGGRRFVAPQAVTAALLDGLRALVPVDPDHLPQALATMQAGAELFPGRPQVACFDTAFHRDMPLAARQYGLPRELFDEGVVRYGFHGISYEYVMQELCRVAPGEADGRIVIEHLGNGASMAAVRGGRSVDTTMGFTPTGGLVMGTRSGDLDPGVLLYLLQERSMDAVTVNELVNRRSGLLGVSGSSADMRDLLARESTDPHAAEAVALFCYVARKYLGALTAALGGLDTLVFTGGIGEHAAPVRRRICDGFEFLGLHLDETHNAAHADVISAGDSRVTVRVMPTNEELMIARHTATVLAGS